MRKYHSIPRKNKLKYLNEICQDCRFVVTEKVHGANFSFQFNDNESYVCSRNSIISNPQSFYNSNVVIEKYYQNIYSLYKYLKEKETIKNLIVYGELFGGNSLPTKNIKSKFSQVQKGIFYTPDIEFLAFDIMIDDKFIDWNMFKKLTDSFQIPRVPVIAENITLEEALKLNTNINSMVPKYYGYEIDNNIIEGVVIKEMNNKYDNKGNRIIFKIINEKFDDVPKNKTNKNKEFIDVSYINEYLNDTRWEKFIAKGYELSFDNFSKLLKELTDDIIKDIDKEITKKERKAINRLTALYLKRKLNELE